MDAPKVQKVTLEMFFLTSGVTSGSQQFKVYICGHALKNQVDRKRTVFFWTTCAVTKVSPPFHIQLLCSADLTNKFTLTNIHAGDPGADKHIGLS